MRKVEKWIWLDSKKYPNNQHTVYHPDLLKQNAGDTVAEYKDGLVSGNPNYTVAEFVKNYCWDKKVKTAKLYFSGDTEFDLWLNGKLIATGPAGVGGDFLFNDKMRSQHFASSVTEEVNGCSLDFYARVKMMPVIINEYSRGHGGFMLTADITFEDGTQTFVTTDDTWQVRKNGRYHAPFCYDGTICPDSYEQAQEISNIWHTEEAPIPVRTEELIWPQGGGMITIPAGAKETFEVTYDKVYGAFLHLDVKTKGVLNVSVKCFELDVENSGEEFVFCEDTQYRGIQLHSVGGYRLAVENHSEEEAQIRIGAIATCYPVTDCAVTETSDALLNKVEELCAHALKYCRQSMHLDSPKHGEPLACTGDYYIESLMTAFSFGDLRLAEFDLLRTSELLRYNKGRMFHTTYSLIWTMMLYDVYMFTGRKELLEDCRFGVIALLDRFETYLGENGLIENPTDYMFIDWLEVDGISLHHPPKNLGQSCLNMFYHEALRKAEQIFSILDDQPMAQKYAAAAAQLKQAINRELFDPQRGLYCEGLGTPSPEEYLGKWMPQTNGKIYFRKHANILAVYAGVCEGEEAKALLRRVMAAEDLGECQPYFMHFLLEAVYRTGLREEFTMQILEQWKESVRQCPKGLQEGFILPPNYTFDLSHAWGGTPLYALPKALMGFEMVKPGFEEIRVSPTLLGLEWANTELLTPYGTIRCSQKQGEKPELVIPEQIKVAQ